MLNYLQLFTRSGPFILLVALVLSISFNLQQCRSIAKHEAQEGQNIRALLDSMEVIKKNNQLYATKTIFLTDNISDLKKLNADLAKSVEQTQKDVKGKVITIEKPIIIYRDTSLNALKTDVSLNDNGWNIDWQTDKNKNLQVKGNTFFNIGIDSVDLSTIPPDLRKKIKVNGKDAYLYVKDVKSAIHETSLKIKLETGTLLNSKGQIEAYVKPLTEGLTIESITGAVVNPNQLISKTKVKRYGIGLHGGYGVMYNNGNIIPGPYVGLGIHYTVFP